MRGDVRPNCNLQTEGVIPADSSSGSSSPHSNSSHDDDILEVTGPSFMPKPIYNFSIPDMIKHEPRMDRHDNSNRLDDNVPVNSRRKRTHAARHIQNCERDEIPVIVRSKRRRRSITAAAENVVTKNDDNCHRPPVIDLTDMDSHDEYHSDSEVTDSRHPNTRPLNHIPHAGSFSEVLSDLQRFRRQLQDSHDADLLFRSSSLQRLQRLRRRTPRPITADRPAVIDNMTFHTPEPVMVSTPEATSADDSVVVVNEVHGNQRLLDDDHSIALRMANDPTFSPPYHSSHETSPYPHRNLSRITRGNDESFNQFQDRIRSIRHRNRERLEQARRISQEAQQRLARIHDSINSLRHGVPQPEERMTNPQENRENENIPERRGGSREREESVDDVEITEWYGPRNLDYLQAPVRTLSPLPPSLHSSLHPLHRRHLPMPDFLRPLMSTFLSPLPPPRLHHLHHIQEDYEALLNLAERIGPAKPRGLNKAEIDLILSFRFSSSTAKETNTKCIICMAEYANREKLRRLPCTHDFHAKCIDKWLRSNKTCPICRDEVNPTPEL